jgi:phospholipase C
MSRQLKVRSVALSAVAAVAIGVSGWVGGCSAVSNKSPSSQDSTDVGSATFALQVGAGITIQTVNYTLTGPGGFVRTGTIDVSNSTTLSAIIGNIPAGMGYVISATATATDGTTNCMGTSAPFTVIAHATVMVSLHLDCHEAARTGSVLVNGTLNVCPVIDGVNASPAEVFVGNSIAISAVAHDSDMAPSPLSYMWTTTSGTIASPSSASTSFKCTAAGPVTLTVTVSDGDSTPGCADSMTIPVTCSGHLDAAQAFATATKIKHLIIVFGENISYDHYFATYPNAPNPPGDPPFNSVGAPTNNNLVTPLDVTAGFVPLSGVDLLNANPNAANTGNGAGAVNPFRLGPAQAATNDQGHNYKPEQQADNNGLMNAFPQFTGTAGPPPGAPPAALTKGLVMGYYDGNTLGVMWNLAQTYAMNDNSWSTVFGPSTPGAINLIAGQTNGFATFNRDPSLMSTSHVTPDGNGGWTLIGDTDPLGDKCSTAADQNTFAGKNIGDLLNAHSISWGFFEGGFDLGITNANGSTGCNRLTLQTVAGAVGSSTDYIPHHQPFQYYASTANLAHTRPSSVGMIGTSGDGANHQYDSHDFFDALAAGNVPAVAYLKAPAFQDGHAGYSNPTDEGHFISQLVGAVQASQEWGSTAIVLLYDDSDGWYDHQMPPIVNQSNGVADALNSVGHCNMGTQQGSPVPPTMLAGNDGNPALGRCGYGTRQPLLVVSPFSKRNYIDHTLTDQSSVLKFIEDNWLAGQRIQPGGSFDTIAGTIQNMMNL